MPEWDAVVVDYAAIDEHTLQKIPAWRCAWRLISFHKHFFQLLISLVMLL